MALMDRLLRLGEGKLLKQLSNVAKQVNAIEEDFVAMSDEELRGQTDDFRARYEKGETLESLLPEAFATVREASRRVLDKRHFDVQVMGGAALHMGNIAEMKTGEGKTLVATMPSYLNALTGARRTHRHSQRLSGQTRLRVDGTYPPFPRARCRRHPLADGSCRTPQGVPRGYHLRHEQ